MRSRNLRFSLIFRAIVQLVSDYRVMAVTVITLFYSKLGFSEGDTRDGVHKSYNVSLLISARLLSLLFCFLFILSSLGFAQES